MASKNRRQLPKMFVWKLLLLFSSVQLSSALIVPQELPSILSLVYSNIPPIKKGTDSRLGFGFRLGEHADFQVILELGPQKETRPLGDQEAESSFSKRHINKAQQMALLHQQLRQQQKELQKQAAPTSTERAPVSWLESWSKDMNVSKKKTKQPSNSGKHRSPTKRQQEKPSVVGSMPAAPVVPEQSLKQLQLLYQMATNEASTTTTPKPFAGGPLNLGGPKSFSLPNAAQADMPSQLLTNLPARKTKGEITAELMNVSLDDDT